MQVAETDVILLVLAPLEDNVSAADRLGVAKTERSNHSRGLDLHYDRAPDHPAYGDCHLAELCGELAPALDPIQNCCVVRTLHD
jgi:hypothetical protein